MDICVSDFNFLFLLYVEYPTFYMDNTEKVSPAQNVLLFILNIANLGVIDVIDVDVHRRNGLV